MQISLNALVMFLMVFLLLIFTMLLFHKGRRKYSNVLLAVYFISQIIGVFGNLCYFNLHSSLDVQVLTYTIIFTWLPLFYLYILSLLYSDFRIRPKHLFHFIPFAVVFCNLIYSYYAKDVKSTLHHASNYETYSVLFQKFSMLFNGQVLLYNVLIILAYLNYQKALRQQFSVINKSANNWVKTSIFGFLIACIVVQIGNYSMQFQFLSQIPWYMVGNIAFFMFFNILFYKAIISPDFFGAHQIKEKYHYSSLGQTEAVKMLQELENFMLEKKPFTDSDLSLKILAKMVNIPERHVSQVLNEYKKQNFFDFVNSYRVQYAMELLKNKENSRRTMLDILFDSGFNSKSAFNTAFKKYSGQTPSDFKKLMTAS